MKLSTLAAVGVAATALAVGVPRAHSSFLPPAPGQIAAKLKQSLDKRLQSMSSPYRVSSVRCLARPRRHYSCVGTATARSYPPVTYRWSVIWKPSTGIWSATALK